MTQHENVDAVAVTAAWRASKPWKHVKKWVFSSPGSGVPLTNTLPKTVLPLTDGSDSYGRSKTTSVFPLASCTEITTKLLCFFGVFFSSLFPEQSDARQDPGNKSKERGCREKSQG